MSSLFFVVLFFGLLWHQELRVELLLSIDSSHHINIGLVLGFPYIFAQ